MSDLPNGWEAVALSEITRTRSGNGKLIKGKLLSAPEPGSFPAFSASGQDVWVPEAEHSGDAIIVSAVGARCGKTFSASGRWSAVANTHVVWPEAVAVDRDWLGLMLNNESFWEKGGSAQPFVKVAKTFEREIGLPPLAEQLRIVAKLHALTARTARARADLDRAVALTASYKQAMLDAALSGRLTEDWRGDVGRPGWTSSTIGEVAIIASGQTPKGIEAALSPDGEVPWYKVSSMNEPENLAGLRSSKFRLSAPDARRLGLRLAQPGSVTFPKRGGAIATNKKRRMIVAGALDLNIMVLTAATITPDFLWWWTQHLDLASISNGSNVPQINNGDVAPLRIDVPPQVEQDEITRRLGVAMIKIDHLADEAAAARRLLDRLDQANLARAFRGELVPQDRTDEPASVLLERVRAARAEMPDKSRSGRRAA